MVTCVDLRKPSVVADFAAGTGNLLRASASRWPRALHAAIDIDQSVISRVTRAEPEWLVGVCDFLNHRSRSHSRVLASVAGLVDVALLNPPFTTIGSARFTASARGVQVTCSKAMAFVVNAIDYLTDRGTLVALLPAGSPVSERDRGAIALLQSFGDWQIIQHFEHGSFEGCTARSTLITVKLHGNASRRNSSQASVVANISGDVARFKPTGKVILVRGTVPVHRVESSDTGKRGRFLHTTHLSANRAWPVLRNIPGKARRVAGPAVLIPRVGKPHPTKLVLLTSAKSVVLSDCIVALKCGSVEAAMLLLNRLLLVWESFAQQYEGTGAPFITTARLGGFLEHVGFAVTTASTEASATRSREEIDRKPPTSRLRVSA